MTEPTTAVATAMAVHDDLATTGLYAWSQYPEVEAERPARFKLAITAIVLASIAAVSGVVGYGYVAHRQHSAPPTPTPHRTVVPTAPAPSIIPQAALAQVPDAILKQDPLPPAAAVPAPAPTPDLDPGPGISADAQYLRLLRQDGLSINSAPDIISLGHLVCQIQGTPPYPQGYQVADGISQKYAAELSLDGAQSVVAAAETIYCPQYS